MSSRFLLPVIVFSQFAGTSLWFAGSIVIDAQPGQSYYVVCNPSKTFKGRKLEIKEIAKSTADLQMRNMTVESCR